MSHRKALGIIRNRFEQLTIAKQQLHKKKYRYLLFLKIIKDSNTSTKTNNHPLRIVFIRLI